MQEKKFSKWTLLAMGVGSVVGAGVVTLIGQAIGITGYSAVLAYAFAVLLGFLYNVPILFVSSAVTLDGGNYTLINTVLGKRWGGIFIICFFLFLPGVALYAVSLGGYVQSLLPNMPVWITATVVLTVFYLTNLVGVAVAGKIQNVMSILLIVGLATFIIMGLGNADIGLITNMQDPLFAIDGAKGFFSAAFLLMFSTYGMYAIAYLSRHVKKPRAAVPFAIFGTTLIIAVLYVGVAIVAATVLPHDTVAFQPLTFVAREIMSTPLFVFFMIAGPFMVLATTTNSMYAMYTEPLYKATCTGWLPKSLGKTNRFGTPWIITTIIYLCTLIPVVLQWDTGTITNAVLLVDLGLGILMMTALAKIPKRYPQAWQNRTVLRHMPTGIYYVFIGLAYMVQAVIIYNSILSIKPYIVIATIITVLFALVYSHFRMKTTEITVDVLGEAEAEAED